ncbi:efflux transporter outer membrane subunit [Caldimonas taiwanensis]|uniref:efflux transporter outer membrane subunit n=1 Tax=Caldimonas taiwanensis TaxID=307483 RepID=UPI0007863B50|nr:efflux transporter outer membrane subunit [Caldimonas taiwanensis]
MQVLKRPRARPWGAGAALWSAAVLVACASPAGIEPSARLVQAEALGVPEEGARAALSDRWWQDLGDAALDGLVARAIEGHPSLGMARARLRGAWAAAQAADAAGEPQLQAGLEATRQRYTDHGMVPPPLAGSMATSATLQLSGAWEIDFFGRHRAALQAALGQVRAAQAEAAAAQLLLTSQVAQTYVQLARLLAQQEVAQRALAQRETVLQLIRQRVAVGLDSQVELAQGEAALPEMRQQIEALDEQIAQTRHALAALTVQPPEALARLAPRLQALREPVVPSVIPADWLGRRPDLQAARERVEAAVQEVAVARAQFYPNVNLVAFAGVASLGLDRLLQAGSAQYGIGPAVRLPILDGGRLRAQLRGKTAELDAAVEAYNAALLDALRETADQITALGAIQRQQAQQRQAQQAAETAFELAVQRYRAGLGTLLTVLSAETHVLTQRRLAADLQARALSARIALVRALGGGYHAPAAARSADASGGAEAPPPGASR